MRIDARNLLDRLGRNGFAYREFEDRFNDLELWPILEALLRDPRLQRLDEVEVAAASGVELPSIAPVEPSVSEGFEALFHRYGTPPAAARAPERRGEQAQDVRAMLRHLSDLGSRGEI